MQRSAGWTTGAVAILLGVAGQLLFSQTPQAPQRPPVFRAGATYVTVDAYPRRDGRIVEGLTAADFQVLEDGKPQAVENFDFIKSPPFAADAERRDPNTKEEGDRWADDPRVRVFVIYLDTVHTKFYGSHEARRPISDFVRRVIGPMDLFGVMTPETPVSQLLFGRRLDTIESELAGYWAWGENERIGRDPVEKALNDCYPPPTQLGPNTPQSIPVRRHRQRKLLDSLDALVTRLAGLRDQRKHVLLTTQGFPLDGEMPSLSAAAGPGVPAIGADPSGKLSIGGRRDGEANLTDCAAQVRELAVIDFRQRFRDLLGAASRANVSFHPIDLSGLDPDQGFNRIQTLREMAENTGGVAIVNTNDLVTGVRRIADETAAFYLLGYYSTNQKLDGKFRRIEVKVTQPKVDISARRGYYSPTEEMMRASEAGAGPTPPAPPTRAPTELALEALGRLRAGAELFSYAVATPSEIDVVAEIAANEVELGRWKAGAEVTVTVTAADGAVAGSGTARIDAGWRSAMVRVPRGATKGPWRVALRVAGPNGAIDDRLDVVDGMKTLLGDAIAYRGTASPRTPVRPVADFQYRRTERVRLDWPATQPLETMSARLLDRKGDPLAIPLTAVDTSAPDRPAVSVDVMLTPLTDGSYVVELTAGRGGQVEKRYVAIKVVR
ncbi:MAG TPA: VWA domain-containing protein [Vicinamibacterales bacterium]|nr:VWA domain-containing protein [Vicinamibacterales bacterium]